MKLEVGKRYVMRNGNKTGPLKQDGITFYGRDTTEDAMRTWGQHGEWYYYHDRTEEDADAYDIVAEYVEPEPQQPLRWVENCKPDKPGIWLVLLSDGSLVAETWYSDGEEAGGYGTKRRSAVFATRCYLGPIPEILPPKRKVVERLWVNYFEPNNSSVQCAWFDDGGVIPEAWTRTDRTREREI